MPKSIKKPSLTDDRSSQMTFLILLYISGVWKSVIIICLLLVAQLEHKLMYCFKKLYWCASVNAVDVERQFSVVYKQSSQRWNWTLTCTEISLRLVHLRKDFAWSKERNGNNNVITNFLKVVVNKYNCVYTFYSELRDSSDLILTQKFKLLAISTVEYNISVNLESYFKQS